MAFQELVLYSCVMGSVGSAAIAAYPLAARLMGRTSDQVKRLQHVRVQQAAKDLDEIFLDVKPSWLKIAYGVGPVTLGLAAYVLTRQPLAGVAGAIVGLLIPDLWMRHAKASRKQKFQAQLVDGLFILSSSLRAGFSLPQAFEQLASEMAPPASQEFGLVIKAHRLGRTLEKALEGLNQRVRSEDLRLVTTALLLARETGGDVTRVIQQLITTIRDRKKLRDKVSTLTVQGRFQAYIMSALPVVFVMFVRSFNPEYFRMMLEEQVGQIALVAAAVLWVVGMILLAVMSKVDY